MQAQPAFPLNPAETLLSPPIYERHEPDIESTPWDFSPQPTVQVPHVSEQHSFVDISSTAESIQTLQDESQHSTNYSTANHQNSAILYDVPRDDDDPATWVWDGVWRI
jgi:hypothetical protein